MCHVNVHVNKDVKVNRYIGHENINMKCLTNSCRFTNDEDGFISVCRIIKNGLILL